MKIGHKITFFAFMCLWLTISGQSVLAQSGDNTTTRQTAENTVDGAVYDTGGEPLPGVSVLVDGHTGLGVATNAEGKFVLRNVPADAKTLTFSYIGMKSQTVKINRKKSIKVFLEDDTHQLKDVVIDGYQQIDRRNLTSSVYTVDMEDIKVPGIASVDQMLEGKVPDLTFTSNSGEIGVTPRLRVRGTSTLIGNREPLWVLDGIILTDPVNLSPDVLNDPDYVNRIGNAVAGINPQDIERIDVLKDAAATALYGTRAANGVIVITTKSGRVGKAQISYNANFTYRRRPRYTDKKIDLMNSNERIQFSQYLAENHYSYPSGMPLVGYEYALDQLYKRQITQEEFNEEVNQMASLNTDWFKILDHDSFSHDHSVNVSGGSDKVRYYTSIGYTDQDDVIKNTTNRRYTAMTKVNMTLSDKFSLEFNANGYVNDRKYNVSETNPTDYAYNTSRAIPAYNADGSYYYYGKYSSTARGYLDYNILNELENTNTKQRVSSAMATINLQYRPLESLFFNWTVSANTQSANITSWYGERSYHVSTLRGSNYGEDPSASSYLPYGGELGTSNTDTRSFTTRFQGNFNKHFGKELDHMINFALGVEASSTKTDGYSRTDYGYFADRGKTFITNITEYPYYTNMVLNSVPTITDGKVNMLSVYGTLTYAYKKLFTINANGRYDGSNRFGSQSNDKLLPIWSVSGNANLIEIFHLNNKEWLDELTLKASYGQQGNMIDGQTPVMILKKGSLSSHYNEFISTVSSFSNPDLKWEKTHSSNIGLDASFFGGRLQIGLEGYYKKTVDAFLEKTISDVNGYESYIINSGTITNKGYNVTWSATPVKLKDFYWILSGNVSKVFNDIKTAPGAETYELSDFLSGTAVVQGHSIGTIWSYKFLGLSPIDGGPIFEDWEERQSELVNMDNYTTYTSVLVPTGKREPDITGSVNNTFTYKQWRLGINLSYSFGAKTRLFRIFDDHDNYNTESNVNRALIDRWIFPGDENKTVIPAILGKDTPGFYYYNGHFSENGNSGAILAESYWTMYDYSDIRVVSADYVKLQNITLTYEFSPKRLADWGLSRLAVSLTGTNLHTFCSSKLKGQTPTQGGFSEVQLSDRPQFTLGLNIQF